MKIETMLLVVAVLLIPATGLHGQQTVCDLFANLESTDGKQLTVSGDVILSKESAALGAEVCDHSYEAPVAQGVSSIFPTALLLHPSEILTATKLREFQNARMEADRLRSEGKVVRASGSFSGRVRVASVGVLPGELTFDSFSDLKIMALPDAHSLDVIPICDLFQNLEQWRGKRIAVEGELVNTLHGVWVVGHCKGAFLTNDYRWPVELSLGGLLISFLNCIKPNRRRHRKELSLTTALGGQLSPESSTCVLSTTCSV